MKLYLGLAAVATLVVSCWSSPIHDDKYALATDPPMSEKDLELSQLVAKYDAEAQTPEKKRKWMKNLQGKWEFAERLKARPVEEPIYVPVMPAPEPEPVYVPVGPSGEVVTPLDAQNALLQQTIGVSGLIPPASVLERLQDSRGSLNPSLMVPSQYGSVPTDINEYGARRGPVPNVNVQPVATSDAAVASAVSSQLLTNLFNAFTGAATQSGLNLGALPQINGLTFANMQNAAFSQSAARMG